MYSKKVGNRDLKGIVGFLKTVKSDIKNVQSWIEKTVEENGLKIHSIKNEYCRLYMQSGIFEVCFEVRKARRKPVDEIEFLDEMLFQFDGFESCKFVDFSYDKESKLIYVKYKFDSIKRDQECEKLYSYSVAYLGRLMNTLIKRF